MSYSLPVSKECIGDGRFHSPEITAVYFHKHALRYGLRPDCRILDVAAGTGLVGVEVSSVTIFPFVALLGFLSRATVMAQASVVRPSSVRKLKFLGNLCMDPDQILWVAPSPPYLQTIFQLCLTMSAELMKSKFVRCPSSVRPSSVCGIDYR